MTAIRATSQPLPAPPQDGLVGEFFEWHRQQQLRLMQCQACSTYIHPPQPTCGRCGSSDVDWSRVTGTGSLFTWTVTHRSFHPMFDAEVPYLAGIVTLDEGPRLLTMLRDVDPAELVDGLRVRVEFETREPAAVVAVFVPDRTGVQQ